jgi:hypothetical protein
MTLKEESLTRFLNVNQLSSQGENGKVRHDRSEQTDAGEQNRCCTENQYDTDEQQHSA